MKVAKRVRHQSFFCLSIAHSPTSPSFTHPTISPFFTHLTLSHPPHHLTLLHPPHPLSPTPPSHPSSPTSPSTTTLQRRVNRKDPLLLSHHWLTAWMVKCWCLASRLDNAGPSSTQSCATACLRRIPTALSGGWWVEIVVECLVLRSVVN